MSDQEGNVVRFKRPWQPPMLRLGSSFVNREVVERLIDVGPEEPWEVEIMTEILRDWLRQKLGETT